MRDSRRPGIGGLLGAFVLASLALGCAPAAPPDNTEEARAGIQAVNAEFMKRVEAKDAAGIAALYTDGAKVLPPNGPPVEGRAAIEQLFAGMLPGIARVQLDTVEVEGHGDTAHELEALAFFDANGTKVDEGKAIVIWKKVGEEWKLHRDIFSSNLPPPPPAGPAAAEGSAGEGAGSAEGAATATP
jgi:uncharacterized protein (TIGR02246 family)